MPTLDWLNRDEAFRIAQRVQTRVLRPHPAGAAFGDGAGGNLLTQGDPIEHSYGLRMMLPRLQRFCELLSKDGSI